MLLYQHLVYKQYGTVTVTSFSVEKYSNVVVPAFSVQTVRYCYCNVIQGRKSIVMMLYQHLVYKEYGTVTVPSFTVQRVQYSYCCSISVQRLW
jgi:hypothetical protein